MQRVLGSSSLLAVLATIASTGLHAEPELVRAFAFGSRLLDCPTHNEPSVSYTMVHQGTADALQYDGSRGWGYEVTDPGATGYARFGPFDDSPNGRTAFPDTCPEEIYDSFIGAKNFASPCASQPNPPPAPCLPLEGIVFRADVPNGTYRFVAAAGEASNPHVTRIVVEDGGAGPPSNLGADHVVLVHNFDQAAHGAGVFARVGFDGRIPPPAAVGGFVDMDASGLESATGPDSPTLEVTQGYIRLHQLKGSTIGTDPNGGDMVVLELWRADNAFSAIDAGSTWRFLPGLQEASSPDTAAWRQPGFDDGAWAAGAAPFGYGNPPLGTDLSTLAPPMQSNYSSLFLRQTFELSNPGAVDRLIARADYDDGFLLWVNGVEVLRINVPGADGDPVAFDGFASSGHESGLPEDYDLPDPQTYLIAGTNAVAAQVFNVTLGSSDLKFDLELFDPDAADLTPPDVASLVPSPGLTVRSLSQVVVTFSEDVAGVGASDLLVDGAPASGASGEGAGPYTFTFPARPDGPVALAWAAGHGITDIAPEPNPFAGGAWSYTIDSSAPVANLQITEVLAANWNGIRDEDGEGSDWIEIYNPGTTAVHLLGMSLTDSADEPGKWIFPDRWIGPQELLLVFASGKDRRPTSGELHTSYKVSSTGEYVGLYDAGAPRQVLAEYAPSLPPQRADISYGLASTGTPGYFDPPTPGAPNGAAASSSGFAAEPSFDPPRGLYVEPFLLELASPTPGASIRYTLDGSWPTQTRGTLYTAPIPIAATSRRAAILVRAVAFKSGLLPSETITHSYVFPDHVMTQPSDPAGFPSTWNTQTADYAMDPRVVNDPGHRELVREGLTSIPTLSLVMDVNDVFGSSSGNYANPSREGVAWERTCSAELIYPSGREGFHITCGHRIQGGSSTSNWKVLKLSMRLLFKGDHGPPKLRFQLFRDTPVEEFDTIVLDAHLNQTWNHPNHGQRVRAQYCRDQYVSDLQNAAGGFAPHDVFAHVYINGLYWGVFDLHERPDSAFAASYFGGSKTDYDVLRHTYSNVVDGSATAWNTMIGLARRDLSVPANYDALQEYLDVVDYADYMMVNFFAGNDDWPHHNWYASRSRATGGIWRIHSWDAEHVLKSVTIDRTGISNALAEIYNNLRANPEWRLLFADRVHRAFFNGGPMSVDSEDPDWDPDFPERNAPASIYMRRIIEIDPAIACEAARWGDVRRPEEPYTRNDEWLAELGWIVNTYFPQRSEIVLNQLRARGLYPSIGAPLFNRHGGTVDPGFVLAMSRPSGTSGTIYFTIDGSDPRTPVSGDIAESASSYTGPVEIRGPVEINARVRFGTEWSALSTAVFSVPSIYAALELSELMYNPPGGSRFEFLELHNAGGTALDLSGLVFTDGIEFAFPDGTTLAAGGYFVLASDPASFAVAHPGVPVGGVYSGLLDNAGERIILEDGHENVLLDIRYDDEDGWPVGADGFGFSLVLEDPSAPERPWAWRAASAAHGSPGATDPAPAHGPVAIQEVLTRTSLPFEDAIELHNPNGFPVDISGWYLSDSRDSLTLLRKYAVPEGTVVPAGGTVVFYENQFNRNPGGAGSFALDGSGDQVYLTATDALGDMTGYIAELRFQGSEEGLSIGSYATSVGLDYAPLEARSFGADAPASVEEFRTGTGAPNALPLVGPVVISELFYHPPESKAEFVELYNLTAEAVDLHDAATGRGWQVRGVSHTTGDGSYEFPEGAAIGPLGFALVVPVDPAFFRSRYDVPAAVPIYGPYRGALDNGGESVRLFRPGVPDAGEVPYILADKVRYEDSPPWPQEADGPGFSLERRELGEYGNEPLNWGASKVLGGTPGTPNTVGPPLPNQPPVASFTVTPSSGPAPLAVTVNASASLDPDGTIARYSWRFGDGATGSGRVSSHTYTAEGTYTVELTVEDQGGLTDTLTRTVTVNAPLPNEPPRTSFTGSPSTGPAPLAVSFDASASSDPDGTIVRYSWTFGDGTNGSGRTTSHTYSQAGTYTVRLTVEDDGGLTDDASRTVTVEEPEQNIPPIAAIAASPERGPAPLPVRFDASASRDPDGILVRYEWDFGDGTTALGIVLTHDFESPGEYTVALRVWDDGGASHTATTRITVTDEVESGFQSAGDCNQDGFLDISDGVCILGHLFLGTPSRLPCDGGTVADPGNKEILDVNGNEAIDLADAVYMLAYLFQGGLPPIQGIRCRPIEGCPTICVP